MGGDARLLGASVARVRIVRVVEPESSAAGAPQGRQGPALISRQPGNARGALAALTGSA